MNKKFISVILAWFGYGITLHAIAGELYDKGGYPEILAPQGEWIGMSILAIALILITYYILENK